MNNSSKCVHSSSTALLHSQTGELYFFDGQGNVKQPHLSRLHRPFTHLLVLQHSESFLHRSPFAVQAHAATEQLMAPITLPSELVCTHFSSSAVGAGLGEGFFLQGNVMQPHRPFLHRPRTHFLLQHCEFLLQRAPFTLHLHATSAQLILTPFP